MSYDIDNDGVVTEKELELSKQIAELKLREEKAATQRAMAWSSVWMMAIFTVLLFSSVISIERIKALSEISAMFYIAQAGIVAGYFGAAAWMIKK
jgi:hypothetical protein